MAPTYADMPARTLSSLLTSSSVVLRFTSNTQSVMEALVSGTRTARPFSLPCCGCGRVCEEVRLWCGVAKGRNRAGCNDDK